MTALAPQPPLTRPRHDWLRAIRLAPAPATRNAVLDRTLEELQTALRQLGHDVQDPPASSAEVLLTTADFGEVVNWREAALFIGRKRYGLEHTPTVYTLISITPARLEFELNDLAAKLAKNPPDAADFAYPGLTERAHHTLIEQGKRGGPILSLLRRLQAQSKSIRIILVVGETEPQAAYYFDLVGAHPRIENDHPDVFYADMATRIVTAISTGEITRHQVVGPVVPRAVWNNLRSPEAMRIAGQELGRRNFFTEMIRVADLVAVPALAESVASQYSEGCFATWEADLPGLIATITGSARPVVKENITEDELAVIVGVRPDGRGAQVRNVEAKRNDPPSSEAVEMMDMDFSLPRITLGAEWGAEAGKEAPVVRSKLHGHRGVRAYHPDFVEFVTLDEPYYHYPVSCSTEAQARAIKAAFARSQALNNPADPRQVVFTVLPGHGIVIAEKWVAGKAPFQVMWEYMDQGRLAVENIVPQGPHTYAGAPQRELINGLNG